MMKQWICLLISALFLSGCATGMQTAYVDPGAGAGQPSLTFNQQDLHMIAGKMIDSLLTSGIFDRYYQQNMKKPIIRVSLVRNKTDEHIDTKAITDSIRTQLLKSGKLNFVHDISEQAAEEEMLREQDKGQTGRYDAKSGPDLGKVKLAKYHLYGELNAIKTDTGQAKTVYYKFTLNLTDTETGLMEWTEEKEISKVGQRATFGG
ncbi:MAG: penicillin-binding protein activator LpoB [Deltaproteobacteria bacterium]|nr:penicillin-binding protein activator LpoB [Deltaproteobacteria bacterium]